MLIIIIKKLTILSFKLKVCPVCASQPGGEPNHVTDDFATHLTLEHRSPRELISFQYFLLILNEK
jgi:hypothetical protein